MTDDTRLGVAIGELALAFGLVNRATYHEDGTTPESDTTHTVMLGLLACTFAPKGYDVGRIAELALVHDLVEAKVGDTNTAFITPEGRAEKEAREEKALNALYAEFADAAWMMSCLTEYEEQESPESRYVRFLDKATPKITHFLNDCAAVKRMGRSYEDLVHAHNTQLEKLLLQYPELAGTRAAHMTAELMTASEEAY